MVMFTKVIGSMIRHRVLVYTNISMVPSISGAGLMIDSMDLVSKSGAIMPSMKVTMKVVKSRG